jgi:hypothetical protein
MIELKNDALVFSFPEVHPAARLTIEFQRTLRIPDNDKTYPLPPGLGAFPLRHVDDHAARMPASWLAHGGILMPMYQAEALWLHFRGDYLPERRTSYPFAIKVATGKIDAVTGKTWSNGLAQGPQNYMVSPTQPWLDGYCIAKGTIRQFVAMPLGDGHTAEEQLTGAAEHGGLQLIAYPMKRSAFERRFPKQPIETMDSDEFECSLDALSLSDSDDVMGLAPGGKMKQEIYADPFDLEDWELDRKSRCFVHLLNSRSWQRVTGDRPPHKPPTAKTYTNAGLPWFDYYDEGAKALGGSSILAGLKSLVTTTREREESLADDIAVRSDQIVKLRAGLSKHQVRDGDF